MIIKPACWECWAVTGRRCPTVGWGKTFWWVFRFFFYGNIRDSETKSKKIDPKVRNEPSLRGLQSSSWQNFGPNKRMRIRWFSVMWVPKLLLPPVKLSIFCPQTAKFCPKYAFLGTYRPCWFIWCPVGWLVGGCGTQAVSRKTPIYFSQWKGNSFNWLIIRVHAKEISIAFLHFISHMNHIISVIHQSI